MHRKKRDRLQVGKTNQIECHNISRDATRLGEKSTTQRKACSLEGVIREAICYSMGQYPEPNGRLIISPNVVRATDVDKVVEDKLNEGSRDSR
jgi:hypothetical protein